MSSLVSTGSQEIVNWVTTADGCVHTDDMTKLSPTSCESVYTPPTPTRQNSFVASAVCIGHELDFYRDGKNCAVCTNTDQYILPK